jgi:hypothetical protein
MSGKYPMPGEMYDSHIYPGQQCEVISILEAQVTMQWFGQYAYIEPQTVAVNQFLKDFSAAME